MISEITANCGCGWKSSVNAYTSDELKHLTDICEPIAQAIEHSQSTGHSVEFHGRSKNDRTA